MVSSSKTERRTIDELTARYFLEPALRDVYVEGSRDRKVFEQYLKDRGHKDFSVIAIDSIEVSRETLEAHALGEGNRNRVIALALELDRRFSLGLSRVRCIVDSDFDFILNSFTASMHLLQTDYTSVDLYTCEKSLLEEVRFSELGVHDDVGDELFTCMFPILKALFLIRASNQALDLGIAVLRLTTCCSIVNSGVVFNRDEFVDRCLQSNAKTDEKDRFESTCVELSSVELDDDRMGIHSDDYLELVGWYLHHRYHWRGYRRGERSILEPLTAALNSEVLSKQPLFSTLDHIYA